MIYSSYELMAMWDKRASFYRKAIGTKKDIERDFIKEEEVL